jgi:hypothetical protein
MLWNHVDRILILVLLLFSVSIVGPCWADVAPLPFIHVPPSPHADDPNSNDISLIGVSPAPPPSPTAAPSPSNAPAQPTDPSQPSASAGKKSLWDQIGHLSAPIWNVIKPFLGR